MIFVLNFNNFPFILNNFDYILQVFVQKLQAVSSTSSNFLWIFTIWRVLYRVCKDRYQFVYHLNIFYVFKILQCYEFFSYLLTKSLTIVPLFEKNSQCCLAMRLALLLSWPDEPVIDCASWKRISIPLTMFLSIKLPVFVCLNMCLCVCSFVYVHFVPLLSREKTQTRRK